MGKAVPGVHHPVDSAFRHCLVGIKFLRFHWPFLGSFFIDKSENLMPIAQESCTAKKSKYSAVFHS